MVDLYIVESAIMDLLELVNKTLQKNNYISTYSIHFCNFIIY